MTKTPFIYRLNKENENSYWEPANDWKEEKQKKYREISKSEKVTKIDTLENHIVLDVQDEERKKENKVLMNI